MRHLGLDPGGTYIKWVVLESDEVVDKPRCNCGNHGCVEAFVREAVEAGDIERAGRYLGIGIANAIVALAPDRAVVGGGVTARAGESLLQPARAEARSA